MIMMTFFGLEDLFPKDDNHEKAGGIPKLSE
jgi:hypothetical protein